MDEKTAAIPSLKDFKEQHKDRTAHTVRTESMQTKDQMRRSQERQQKKTSSKSNSSKNISRASSTGERGERSPSSGGNRTSSKGSSSQRPSRPSSQRPQSSDARRPSDSERRTYARDNQSSQAQKRPSQSAPRTYARARNEETERRRRSPQPHNSREAVSQRSPGTAKVSAVKSDREHRASQPQGAKPVPAKSRKNSKKGKKPMSPAMRKFRSFLIYLSIILIVIIVGGVLSLTVLFKTNNINVNGLNGFYSEQEILSASGLTTGINIFTAPKARAEDKIEKKFPYIERADVSSSFPDTINIDVTIATPACVIEGLGGFYIVSDKGKILEVSATDDEVNVPIIEGVNVEAAAAGEYVEYGSEVINQTMQEIFAAFREYGCKNITAINIKAEEDSFAIKYVYDNRIVVFLGLPEHINYKIQTADKIIKEKLDIGGTMVAGDLDVSMCHDTMKSYFNQYTLLAPQVKPVEGSTEKPTETQSYEEYTEEEYYDDSQDYNSGSEDYYDDSEDYYYEDPEEDAWIPEEDYEQSGEDY